MLYQHFEFEHLKQHYKKNIICYKEYLKKLIIDIQHKTKRFILFH